MWEVEMDSIPHTAAISPMIHAIPVTKANDSKSCHVTDLGQDVDGSKKSNSKSGGYEYGVTGGGQGWPN
ncbi:MAG: hypothetical protein ACK559_02220, partial [bacterium]